MQIQEVALTVTGLAAAARFYQAPLTDVWVVDRA